MTPKLVEVTRDALGWLLVFSRDWHGNREGEPVGDPEYFKTRAAAERAAKQINDNPDPRLVKSGVVGEW